MPRGGVKRKEGITVHATRALEDADRTQLDAIPVTSVARTLLDLADVLDDARFSDAVNEAEIKRVFDLVALDATAARLPGRHGRHRVRRVLASYRPEPRLLRNDRERLVFEICRRHGLPLPQTNTTVLGHEVRFPVACGRPRPGVRRLGHPRHSEGLSPRPAPGPHLRREDIQVVRATWPDLRGDGAELARQLAAILASRIAD